MQLNIDGIDTRYVLSNEGGGPWLTFIHQLGGDLSIWDQMAGYFRDDYTVLRYDVRGHGATAVTDTHFSIADLAHDLASLLDALGVTHTHLVGISMGGMIAQQFALDYPQRVDTLTLADTSAGTPPEGRAVWDQRAASARNDGLAALASATIGRWLTPDFQQAHPEAVEQIREVLLQTSPQGYARACEALRDFDVRDRLAALRMPTLTVAGRHDTGTPPAATAAIAEAIEGARHELLDAAHLAPIEQSQRFAAMLETFLQSPV
ncbi:MULTISPECIES: 3-oxoadipate enol-lactonase [Paraburkholderia]|uniref:3-oxoadipate enol-lactonase n=1 Tax=Paraburkholderia TaxID=1822464 RepID=UPI0022569675|nr:MULTISPECIES: 3-oxoadipate enol-lactonase [Paraburkholderia]MCX4163967.1 3-oxoadipate enol-lactonase [Paraburkholderia megapolitana]MDN7159462.1 3-oxoadipate enol-lactonase [Paraburkholderia sp. CHISQ3]MDQ6496509.1 3-oxoadipate enol-lactonase [Paraburkholderia megapolitana]